MSVQVQLCNGVILPAPKGTNFLLTRNEHREQDTCTMLDFEQSTFNIRNALHRLVTE